MSRTVTPVWKKPLTLPAANEGGDVAGAGLDVDTSYLLVAGCDLLGGGVIMGADPGQGARHMAGQTSVLDLNVLPAGVVAPVGTRSGRVRAHPPPSGMAAAVAGPDGPEAVSPSLDLQRPAR